MRRTIAGLIASLLMLTGLAAPARAVAAPDRPWRCDAPAGVGQRTVVLLVHGFNSSADAWNETSQKYLATSPATCIATFDYASVSTSWVTDLGSGQASIAHDLATTILSLAEKSKNGGGSGKIIVVAHSMGGLATRCAADDACAGVQGAGARIRALITLGTPTLGSFLRANGRSYLADLIGPVLSASCYAGVLKPPVLDGLCSQVRALGTSKAAKAFTPGSKQLDSIKVDTPFPIMAVAGSVKLDTSFFGHAVTTVADAGDLVVDQASALAAHKTIQGVGGTQVIDCGNVDLTGLGGGIVTAALYQTAFERVTCDHIRETNDPQFLAKALNQITKIQVAYSEGRQGSPCTAAAIGADVHAEVAVPACHAGWAIGDVVCAECEHIGRLFRLVNGRWKQVGSVLQDCAEDLVSQHVPRATARLFYRYCSATLPTLVLSESNVHTLEEFMKRTRVTMSDPVDCSSYAVPGADLSSGDADVFVYYMGSGLAGNQSSDCPGDPVGSYLKIRGGQTLESVRICGDCEGIQPDQATYEAARDRYRGSTSAFCLAGTQNGDRYCWSYENKPFS